VKKQVISIPIALTFAVFSFSREKVCEKNHSIQLNLMQPIITNDEKQEKRED
jgi:hypothetical protein